MWIFYNGSSNGNSRVNDKARTKQSPARKCLAPHASHGLKRAVDGLVWEIFGKVKRHSLDV